MSPRTHSSTPAGHVSDKRAALLDAALALFAEAGFYGTSVPLIAERAGVAVGTVYHYFSSKEAIVNELYRDLKWDMAQMLWNQFPFEAPFREQFHLFWVRMIEYALAHPLAYTFLELHHHAAYLDEESHDQEKIFDINIGKTLGIALQKGVVKPLPIPLLVAIIYGAARGVIQAVQEGHLELTPELIAAAEGCCWEAIEAPPGQ